MRNGAWLLRVRNYYGHNTRAAWSLLRYEPRYCSFNKRRGNGVEALLFGEEMNGKQVTLAVHVGRPIEFGERASLSCLDPGPTETTAVVNETSSRLRR